MNFTQLKTRLGIADGTIKDNSITISTNTLTGNIAKLIRYCYDGQPIVITNAELVSTDDESQAIIIKGTSSFLLIPNLPVELYASIDSNQKAQLLLKYSLIGDMPKPDKWHFSRSFPELPRVIDRDKPILFDRATQETTVTESVPLDDLYLFNSFYMVTSSPQQEPDFNVNLGWGINFVSRLRPLGFLGIIENVFQYTTQLTVYGTIRKPLPNQTANNLARQYPSSLEHFIYPWNIVEDFPEGLPGILLQVDLGLDYSIAKDKIQFKGEKLYIYTPLDDDWTLGDTNPRFVPTQAYTGKISLPGAGIEIDMVAPSEIGMDEFQLIGFFEGISLSNLSQMVGLTGSSKSPLEQLPDSIKNMGEKLGQLELTGASVAIDYNSLTDIHVSYASFTIGMPDLNWQIWDDHFQIDNIYCHFDIYYPFSTSRENDTPYEREYIVTVYGQLQIEGVPFKVFAGNQDGFTVYAEMAEAQTIPLEKILKTYAPGIPTPSDLTIDSFRLEVAPGKQYSMALAMAGEPNPWVISIGPKKFKVEDVSMGFSYPHGGPISGSISGTIAFGSIASLSIAYDIPGDIIIRSMIPEVRLKQLTNLLTNQKVSLPGNFDLTFIDSYVMLKKQEQNYQFILGTQIEDFGSLAFQVERVGGKWGFAAGLDMSSGMPSAIKGLEFFEFFEKFVTLQKFMIVVSSIDNPDFTFPDMAAFQVPAIASKQVNLPVHAGGVISGLNVYAQWQLDMENKAQKLLKNLLKLDSAIIGMTLQVGLNPREQSRLYM
ncbi:MAG: hypothetical protein KAW12_00555, partial [Candidatus Aminicenantes bacterium]|nr:hypothetical protein [Candidatus Aminicenantes bacterium]